MAEAKFQEYFRKQLAAAGAELIKRANDFDLSGLDYMTECQVSFGIPMYGEHPVFPDIVFRFSVINDSAVKELMNKNEDAENIINEGADTCKSCKEGECVT